MSMEPQPLGGVGGPECPPTLKSAAEFTSAARKIETE